jgi:hypothetical protein
MDDRQDDVHSAAIRESTHREPPVTLRESKKTKAKVLGKVIAIVASVLTIVLAIVTPSTFWIGLAAVGAIVLICFIIFAINPIVDAIEAVRKYPGTKQRLAEALSDKGELEKKIGELTRKKPNDLALERQLGEESILARLRGDLSEADLELEAISATDDGVELFASRSGGREPGPGAWFAVKTRKLEKTLGYVGVVETTANAHIRLKLTEATDPTYWANIIELARTTETPPPELKLVRDDIIAKLQHQEVVQ